MATLIGTPPNAFFAGYMHEAYGRTIGFAEWMLLGLPLALIALPLMLFILVRIVYPIRITEIPGGQSYFSDLLREMGAMQRGEKMVRGVFVTTAILWITRPLMEGFVPGMSDAGIAIAMALVLFILPVDLKTGTFVMDWKTAEKLPWGVLILFGGGLSLASAISTTGLASWIGSQMELFSEWPILAVIFIVTTTIVVLTELTSNTATSAAFLPIAASVAVGLGHDPMVLGIPAVLAASCAFMLPVATPPNAIVFGSSFVTIPQMARAGVVLNTVFIILISLLAYLFLPLLAG
jgi:sodium-dependent dicarboxylate transporter 2/3/5